jgi:hypothetical protein
MAVSSTDPMYQEHYRTWLGFTRFIKIMLVLVVLLLVGLAIFVA